VFEWGLIGYLAHSSANKSYSTSAKIHDWKWFMIGVYLGLLYSGTIHQQILLFGVLCELINSYVHLC